MHTPYIRLSHLLSAIFLLSVSLFMSCREEREAEQLLLTADSLIEAKPDSVLAMLTSRDSLFANASKCNRMRYEILKADANNKCFNFIATDSAFREVVDYYDRHGSPNEKTKAYYLMGCIFRDKHDIPSALEHFYTALEKADTLSNDCDNLLLMRIWGQIAEAYDDQYMIEESITPHKEYSRYALKAGNTFESIRGLEFCNYDYFELKDTLKVLQLTEKLKKMYLEAGYPDYAHNCQSVAAYIYIARGNRAKAEKLVGEIVEKGGITDRHGEFIRNRERNYHLLGQYYMLKNQFDSAENNFRKLIKHRYYADAYNGLLSLYAKEGKTDSVYKYAPLSHRAFTDLQTYINGAAALRMKNSYNYSAYKSDAIAKANEAVRNWRMFCISSLIGIGLLALIVIAYYYYQKQRRLQTAKQNAMRRAYLSAEERLHEAEKKISVLQDIMDEKKNIMDEMELLKQEVEQHKQVMKVIQNGNNDELLNDCIIVKQFRNHITNASKLPNPTEQDWLSLEKAVSKCAPIFYAALVRDNCLTQKELRVCFLVRLSFPTKSIATLMNCSIQSVTNAKASANEKLFGHNDARSLNKQLLSI